VSEKALFDETAAIAYELWEKNGFIHGCDIEHWHEAERIVLARLQPEPEKKTHTLKSLVKTSEKASIKTAASKPKEKKPTAKTKKK
jgi:hypothetical protein